MIQYKNKSGYRRRLGHRQRYTQVRITGIGTEAKAEAKASTAKASTAKASTAKASTAKASSAKASSAKAQSAKPQNKAQATAEED